MISGFIVIDKPAGITSHDVVSRVRRILGTRKVGHTGTLDPFATGVLPVAVNDGTKAIPFLDEGSKTYEALLRLGVATDTLDMTGTILSSCDPSAITRSQFCETLSAFTGAINQVPPMYSAIKQNGQPLYKLARKGQEVERQARPVEIHSLEVLSFDLPHVAIRVTCSRGTYVRTLADDIGRSLGCGAALQELRRTSSGPFQIASALTLGALEEAAAEERVCAVTPSAALAHLPDVPLCETGLTMVRHGRAPGGEHAMLPACAVGATVLIRLTWRGELAAVAQLGMDDVGMPRIVLKRVFV